MLVTVAHSDEDLPVFRYLDLDVGNGGFLHCISTYLLILHLITNRNTELQISYSWLKNKMEENTESNFLLGTLSNV